MTTESWLSAEAELAEVRAENARLRAGREAVYMAGFNFGGKVTQRAYKLADELTDRAGEVLAMADKGTLPAGERAEDIVARLRAEVPDA